MVKVKQGEDHWLLGVHKEKDVADYFYMSGLFLKPTYVANDLLASEHNL